MSRHKLHAAHWILIAAGAILFLGAGEYAIRGVKPPPAPRPSPYTPGFGGGHPAPEFELPDGSGRKHRLSRLVRGPTLLLFVDDSKNSVDLLRYVADLCRLRGKKAPRIITVAGFGADTEVRFRQATGLAQTILYESPGGTVSYTYRAAPPPRAFYLDSGPSVVEIGASAGQSSTFDLAVQIAEMLKFESPYTGRPGHRGPMPVGLDQSRPR